MLRKNKLVLVLMMVFATSLFAGCSSNAAVGIVDVNKVMTESPKVKQFQEQLNTKGKELSDQLEKEQATMSPEDFQKKQAAVSADFMKTKKDMEEEVHSSIEKVLEGISKDKKLSIVLYKDGVAQGGTDITDEVIQKLQ